MKYPWWYPAYVVFEWVSSHLYCALFGHMWDSERPKGPLGYQPDRCWRCDKTRGE